MTLNLTGSTTRWIDRPFATTDSSRVWVESTSEQGKLVVYWSPKPFGQNQYPVGWNVYRAISPDMVLGSPQIEKLNSAPIVVPMWIDLTADTRVAANWYYLVTELFSSGAETRLERPVTLGQWFGGEDRPTLSPVRIYREFRRRKHLVLDRTAERVDFLIRRRAGTRCSCYAPEYESILQSECRECYGTGWVRGYEVLRSVKCRVLSISEVLKVQPRGLVFDSKPKGWLVDFPIARNGDIVIRRNGERYEIDQVDPVIHQGVLTEQNFSLTSLPETHPVYLYSIPVSDDV
jgi:hypothetical protein